MRRILILTGCMLLLSGCTSYGGGCGGGACGIYNYPSQCGSYSCTYTTDVFMNPCPGYYQCGGGDPLLN